LCNAILTTFHRPALLLTNPLVQTLFEAQEPIALYHAPTAHTFQHQTKKHLHPVVNSTRLLYCSLMNTNWLPFYYLQLNHWYSTVKLDDTLTSTTYTTIELEIYSVSIIWALLQLQFSTYKYTILKLVTLNDVYKYTQTDTCAHKNWWIYMEDNSRNVKIGNTWVRMAVWSSPQVTYFTRWERRVLHRVGDGRSKYRVTTFPNCCPFTYKWQFKYNWEYS
jgi:hypothetical protein